MSNTNYYAAELMIYFEKHRFLEVLRVLIIRIGLDRPLCVKHYLRRNLRKIANTVLTKNAIIHIPDEFDVDEFVRNCLKMYKIPIITYNTRGKPVNQHRLQEILRKFEKFCRRSGIHKKNKIYLNFPENFSQVLTMHNCDSPPVNMIHVTLDEPHSPDFKEVLKFYRCNMKNVRVKCDEEDNFAEKDVIPEIMYKLKYTPKTVPYDISVNFLLRVSMLGLRGSGTGTQAKLLADRFNLVYVDVDKLIRQTLHKKDNMSRVLCISYKKENQFSSSSITALVWRRLLEKDALQKGWVVVGFPKCVNEMRTFIEKFQTPPNRVAVIHCSKNLALRRLIKKWENERFPMKIKANTTRYAEKEFILYDEHKNAMYDYLKKSGVKTIHVDGTPGICPVRNKIFAMLEIC